MGSYFLVGEISTWKTMLSCSTIVIGYILGIEGEINFSLRGTLFGVGASLIGCFYTILLHHYLTQVVKDSWILSFYNNLNSIAIIAIVVVMNGEIPILCHNADQLTLSFFFWTMMGRDIQD